MSLRNQLALLFTAIVSVLLGLSCLVLYWVAEKYRGREFENRLKAEATSAGHFLVGPKRIGPALYKLMDQNQLTVLPREELVIYDPADKLVYESGNDYLAISAQTLALVRQLNVYHFEQDEREIVGVVFREDKVPYVIFASGVDVYGLRMTRNLAQILFSGWILMTGIMLVAGRFYAGRMLRPISDINQRIDRITASNLSQRLPVGEKNDEITQLGQRFNRMLNRLEDAFRLQRTFVSNASHELRTPLTAITGQLEVSLLADDDPEELRATLRSVLDDVRGLNRMVNGLLALASANMDASSVPMGMVHLNTLLDQVITEMKRLYPQYTIDLTTQTSGAGNVSWQLIGNEALLKSAIFNLIENSCKFSPAQTANVQLTGSAGELQLAVHNTGPAIPPDQQEVIFIPFQRARNASGKQGFGIGLPLTKRIVELHKGQLALTSTAEAGTTFTIRFPS